MAYTKEIKTKNNIELHISNVKTPLTVEIMQTHIDLFVFEKYTIID